MQLSGSSFLFGFSGIQALSISCDTISSPCTPGGKNRVIEEDPTFAECRMRLGLQKCTRGEVGLKEEGGRAEFGKSMCTDVDIESQSASKTLSLLSQSLKTLPLTNMQ